MRYLIEFYVNTDGDFYFSKTDDFQCLKICDELIVADAATFDEVISLLRNEIVAIIHGMEEDNTIRVDLKRAIGGHLNDMFFKIKYKNPDDGEIIELWSNGNQYGYVRIFQHELGDATSLYHQLFSILNALGITDASMLFYRN